MKQVCEAFGKTPTEAYEFFKIFVFTKLRGKIEEYDLQKILNHLQTSNFSETHFREILKKVGVKKQDFGTVKSFRKAFSDFLDIMNQEEYLGIVLNFSYVATVGSVKDKFNSFREYADIYVETTENKRFVVEKIINFNKERPCGPILLLVNISTPENNTSIIAEEYDVHENNHCTYVTLLNHTALIQEEVQVTQIFNQSITAKFTNNSVFKVGSPLFGKKGLYGLAEQIKNDSVNFTTFFPPSIGEANINAAGVLAYVTVLGLACWFNLV